MSKIEIYFNQRWEILKETKLFQTEIEKIRNLWKIPPNGFENEEEEIEWRDYFSKLDADYFIDEYEPLLLQLLQRAKSSTIKDYPIEKRQEEQLELQLDRPINRYNADIENLRNSLIDFPRSWLDFLRAYIEWGERVSQSLDNLKIEKRYDEQGRLVEILLGVFSYTNFRDIKGAWGEVKTLQESMPLYRKNIRLKEELIHRRDLFILRLHKEGQTPIKIADALEEKYRSEKRVDPSFYELELNYISNLIRELQNSVIKS